MAVEAVELIRAALLLDELEPVAQVKAVVVQETLLLDEVDEHQAVEHHRGVPLAVVFQGDAVDELQEGGVFLLEQLVEAFGDTVHVEGGPHPTGDFGLREVFFLGEREADALEFLQEGVAGLVLVVGVLTEGRRLAALAFPHLPNLRRLRAVGEDHNVFVSHLGRLPVDAAALRRAGEGAAGAWRADVGDQAALFGDGVQGVGAVVQGHLERACLMMLPAQFVEQGLELELPQQRPQNVEVGGHQLILEIRTQARRASEGHCRSLAGASG